jgi:hypothetical protein
MHNLSLKHGLYINNITFEYDNPSSSRSVLMAIDAGNFSNEVPGGRQTSNNSPFNAALICSSFNLKVTILSFKMKLHVSN